MEFLEQDGLRLEKPVKKPVHRLRESLSLIVVGGRSTVLKMVCATDCIVLRQSASSLAGFLRPVRVVTTSRA